MECTKEYILYDLTYEVPEQTKLICVNRCQKMVALGWGTVD